jgi:hypothetical protein
MRAMWDIVVWDYTAQSPRRLSSSNRSCSLSNLPSCRFVVQKLPVSVWQLSKCCWATVAVLKAAMLEFVLGYQEMWGWLPRLLLFLSMCWDCVSELRPPTCLLFIPLSIYEWGEPRWNDIDRIKPKNSEENLPLCYFFQCNFHMVFPGPEPLSPQWESGG